MHCFFFQEPILKIWLQIVVKAGAINFDALHQLLYLSYLKLLLICLLELGFGFDQSLLRGKPVGKSPYYRSFDRSANWRVKDSIADVPQVTSSVTQGSRYGSHHAPSLETSWWIGNKNYQILHRTHS